MARVMCIKDLSYEIELDNDNKALIKIKSGTKGSTYPNGDSLIISLDEEIPVYIGSKQGEELNIHEIIINSEDERRKWLVLPVVTSTIIQ